MPLGWRTRPSLPTALRAGAPGGVREVEQLGAAAAGLAERPGLGAVRVCFAARPVACAAAEPVHAAQACAAARPRVAAAHAPALAHFGVQWPRARQRRPGGATPVVERIVEGRLAAQPGLAAHLLAAEPPLPGGPEGGSAAVLGRGAELGQRQRRELQLRAGVVRHLNPLGRPRLLLLQQQQREQQPHPSSVQRQWVGGGVGRS